MSRKRRFKEARASEREGSTFIALPHVVVRSPAWASLSPSAVKLLIDVWAQFKGDNNGDLTAAFSVMRKRGWRSKTTLSKAVHELRQKDFLIETRAGGRNHIASLYAVSFYAIHRCINPKTGQSKHDAKPTSSAPGGWNDATPTARPVRSKVPLLRLVQKVAQFELNRSRNWTTPMRKSA